MAKRLNDIAAVAALPSTSDERVSVSVSSRRIENGYVVSRSEDGPDGYRYSETFQAEKPALSLSGPADEVRTNVGSGGMRRAVDFLNK